MNKVHPILYKLNRKRQNNELHLNNIRKKNTVPSKKQRGADFVCVLLSRQII